MQNRPVPARDRPRPPAETEQFRALKWRLLLSFLAVIVAILGVASVAIYEFFGYTLYRQLDRQLFVLAEAAAHGLESVKDRRSDGSEAEENDGDDGDWDDEYEDDEYEDDDDDEYEDEDDGEYEDEADRGDEFDPLASLAVAGQADDDALGEGDRVGGEEGGAIAPRLDGDGDLDLPWQSLQRPEQGLEWYDETGTLLAREGTLWASQPLAPTDNPDGRFDRRNGIRSLTVPVYELDDRGRPELDDLEGYVRASEATAPVDLLLRDLAWGMAVGWGLALGLAAAGGAWLTRQSLRPIERSFAQLKQFTADASHELRGPLTAIRASVEVMQSHPERIHPADADKLRAIASATGQMTRLTEDLLLLARSDASAALLAREWTEIPLAALLEELADWFAVRAETQGLKFAVDLAPSLAVKGDAALLRRLFSNLLDNALAYTSEGGCVTLSLERRDRWAIARVTDTGIGIAPEDLPRVFDRLWRADKARGRRASGFGLGLAIARAIAEKHGGAIAVTSELGRGSCFAVRLPAIEGSAESAEL